MNENDSTSIEVQDRKARLDVSRLFLTYLATFGDAAETARTSRVPVEDVQWLARVECWDSKMKELNFFPEKTKEKSVESLRGRNRVALYVQAVRLQGILDAAICQIYEHPENVEKFCMERDKRGNPFLSMRPLKEMVEATERVHSMMYRALGDAAPKAVTAGELSPKTILNVKELHMSVIQTMTAAQELNQTALEPAIKQVGALQPVEAFLEIET